MRQLVGFPTQILLFGLSRLQQHRAPTHKRGDMLRDAGRVRGCTPTSFAGSACTRPVPPPFAGTFGGIAQPLFFSPATQTGKPEAAGEVAVPAAQLIAR